MFAHGAVALEEVIELMGAGSSCSMIFVLPFSMFTWWSESISCSPTRTARACHGGIVQGIEEAAQLYLVCIAFIVRGVARGRRCFMAVTVIDEKRSRAWRQFFASFVEHAALIRL
jgi:hypothetical protein